MSDDAWLVTYCLTVVLFSCLGGYLPFLGQVTHARLQLYLSLAAGVMLGAAFFHVMPEAMALSGDYFGWWMSLGAVGLFCIERFIAPHSHELDGGARPAHTHEHAHGGEPWHEHKHHGAHDHVHPAHEHAKGDVKDQRAAAPAVAGWAAVFGLTIHTFMNGVGLAGLVQAESDLLEKSGNLSTGIPWLALPGFAMFLAIVLHKPADALAISTVLSRKGVSRRRLVFVQLGFAAMVPAGAAAFYCTRGAIAEDMQNQLTGAALAFSAGTFLFIALSDLLPEVQFHRHDRIPLFLALCLGVAFMGGIAYLEPHSHGQSERNSHDEDHDHHHHGHSHDH